MISLDESIPTKNQNYRLAEDIFFVQFNDISFYIEDEDQENFYFCVLKKLFSDIKLEKIFPLCGKENVIQESVNNLLDNRKVFIVDKDFDDILGRMQMNANLFYLDRYSIENHLMEAEAFIKYIIGEKPKLKRREIETQFDLGTNIQEINRELRGLICLHLVVQLRGLKLKNVSLGYERFFEFQNGVFSQRQVQLEEYCETIKKKLSQIDRRLTLNAQIRRVENIINLDTLAQCIKHLPGKYLLRMVKQVIEGKFGLASRNIDSFCYRLAEYCTFNSLNRLKLEIENYVNYRPIK